MNQEEIREINFQILQSLLGNVLDNLHAVSFCFHKENQITFQFHVYKKISEELEIYDDIISEFDAMHIEPLIGIEYDIIEIKGAEQVQFSDSDYLVFCRCRLM